ncbi:MAG: bifunctional phosphopantothenoylcysteine decarboxylase/phosphopantothenate--cysteine ligase CoaBC [Acidobacteriota bacterium]
MRIILGVTGCIGAYKSALVLRLLQKQGFEVLPVMTRSSREFITPLTLEKLSGNRVISELFEDQSTRIEHIRVARESALLLVAPATANVIGKFAQGIADDFLSTLYLSTVTPVVVAPAMNVEMWRHPATLENLRILQERGVTVVEPGSGYLACGEEGEGRLAEPEDILQAVLTAIRRDQSLSGQRILVTAGPTIEDIDPVRYISNRSSGKMGYALAEEAARRGGLVTLVSGPTHLKAPSGVRLVGVRSAFEMASVVFEHFGETDIVVMAAAVSDFTPAEVARQKVKKGEAPTTLRLERTTDILKELGRRKQSQFLVGFAAESQDVRQYARKKIQEKNLDLIVANDISSREQGFEADVNQVSIQDFEGGEESLPLMSKVELARLLWDRIELALRHREEHTVPGASGAS